MVETIFGWDERWIYPWILWFVLVGVMAAWEHGRKRTINRLGGIRVLALARETALFGVVFGVTALLLAPHRIWPLLGAALALGTIVGLVSERKTVRERESQLLRNGELRRWRQIPLGWKLSAVAAIVVLAGLTSFNLLRLPASVRDFWFPSYAACLGGYLIGTGCTSLVWAFRKEKQGSKMLVIPMRGTKVSGTCEKIEFQPVIHSANH